MTSKNKTPILRVAAYFLNQAAYPTLKLFKPNQLFGSQLRQRLIGAYKKSQIGVIYDIGAHTGDWASEFK